MWNLEVGLYVKVWVNKVIKTDQMLSDVCMSKEERKVCETQKKNVYSLINKCTDSPMVGEHG